MRIKHCRAILKDYVSGKIKNIDALDEDILPFNDQFGNTVCYIPWVSNALIKYSDD